MPRPSWIEFWFTLVLMYSTRGTCDRLHTACLIVKDNRLISAGYNGSPHGAQHCDEAGHRIVDGHCVRTLHGEENAIYGIDRSLIEGATAYVIGTPCLHCAKILAQAGIAEIHSLGVYGNSLGKEFLELLFTETGIRLTTHDINPQVLLETAHNRLTKSGGAIYRYLQSHPDTS